MKIHKIYNLILSYWIIFEVWWGNHVNKYFPKIFIGLPSKPPYPCKSCGEEFTKVVAIYTGDGWAFAWECDNNCGDEESIDDWFPFYFNWCSGSDLEKHGIETI